MANFYNPCKADAMCHPDKTTVVGDIERWAELYLDTGQHATEWDCLMATQLANFVKYGATPELIADYELCP